MESMYFLIPMSFLFVALAIGLYIWAVHSGQYDDLDVEGQRILFDQEDPPKDPPHPHSSDAPLASPELAPPASSAPVPAKHEQVQEP